MGLNRHDDALRRGDDARLGLFDETNSLFGHSLTTIAGPWSVLLMNPLFSWQRGQRRQSRIETIRASGFGVLYLNNRGYGGSGGSPTEENNVADAIATYDYLIGLGVRASSIVASHWVQARRCGSQRKGQSRRSYSKRPSPRRSMWGGPSISGCRSSY